MNHKRKKPKQGRAGCLMCKPHKHTALKDTQRAQPVPVRRVMQSDRYSSDYATQLYLDDAFPDDSVDWYDACDVERPDDE